MSRGNCVNPKENFRIRQEADQQETLAGMIECADCGYGFTPMKDGGKTLCDDCIENRQYWEEMDAERAFNLNPKLKPRVHGD